MFKLMAVLQYLTNTFTSSHPAANILTEFQIQVRNSKNLHLFLFNQVFEHVRLFGNRVKVYPYNFSQLVAAELSQPEK